jgi:hypothetical protein
MPMLLQEKVEVLHNAKVINKDLISDVLKSRLDHLTDEDINRLIEIANKLDPYRTSCAEIMLLF